MSRTLVALIVALAVVPPTAQARMVIDPPTSSAAPEKVDLPTHARLDFSGLLDAIKNEKVLDAHIAPVQGRIAVVLKDSTTAEVPIPPGPEADRIASALAAQGVPVRVDNDPPAQRGSVAAALIRVFSTLLILGVVIGLFIFLGKRMGGGGVGQTARKPVASIPTITFKDVAGCDEAVAEVSEMVTFLRHPERFSKLGARMPGGLLMEGPPGTGKTLLARATAGEAKLPFFSMSGSEFVQMYVGVGAARIRDLFEQARKCPDGAIIFIDEFDALGRARSGDGGGAGREHDSTLNQLLVEMDGFEKNDKIVVIAATNLADTLDKAVLRPGRFDRKVMVALPREPGRLKILELHAKGKPLADDVDLARLARITDGMSGADLAHVINEAAVLAATEDEALIRAAHLEEGMLRALMGRKRAEHPLSDHEKDVVAHHEAGHVLVAELCKTTDVALRATIEPRGHAMGVAVYGRTDRHLEDAEQIHERLMALLGGRAAEQVIFGRVTSGAANDLLHASRLARQAISQLGLSVSGQLVAENPDPQTRREIETYAAQVVDAAYRDALALLEEHRTVLAELADGLLAEGDLNRRQIEERLGNCVRDRQAARDSTRTGVDRPGATLRSTIDVTEQDPSTEQRRVEALLRELVSLLAPVARDGRDPVA